MDSRIEWHFPPTTQCLWIFLARDSLLTEAVQVSIKPLMAEDKVDQGIVLKTEFALVIWQGVDITK